MSQTLRVTRDIQLFQGEGRDGNRAAPIILMRAQNGSGGALARGDVVIWKKASCTADLMQVTTTTAANNGDVAGMVYDASIADGAIGWIQVFGPTSVLKVDGTTDIAIGDYLSTFTAAKIAQKTTGAGVFAYALEAYATNDSNGVIDAFIVAFGSLGAVRAAAHTHVDAGEGGTLTLAVIADVTASAAELNRSDITTLGTAQASKVLTSDANIDTTGIRHLTLTGLLTAGSVAAKKVVTAAANDGAISIADGVVKITKATAAALTLADPAAGDEGTVIIITSQTAAAHTVSNAGGSGFGAQGAGADVATFGGAIGDGFAVVAINANWHIMWLQNVTLS